MFRAEIEAKNEHGDQIALMRFSNYDSRRRHKLKVLAKYINDNRTDLENENNTEEHMKDDRFQQIINERMEKDKRKLSQLQRVQ